MKIVRRRALRGEMLCRRSIVEVAALARDFDEAYVARAAALSSVIRTVLSFMSENETLATLDHEKVIIRGKYLLKVMATEYSENGEFVTCASQWNWRVDDFSRRVLYFIQFIGHRWPNIDWHMFSTALHEHVLLLRKQSAATICET